MSHARPLATAVRGRHTARAAARIPAAPFTADTAIGCAVAVGFCVYLARMTGASHWALVVLGICGAIEAPTLVRWLRGKTDAFDPKSIVTLLVFHNTFVAPALHLLWDWYTPMVRVPQDPWEWFGRLALINVGALVCFEAAYRRTVARPAPLRPVLRIRSSRLALALALGAVVALAAQVKLLQHFGGPAGLIEAYEARSDQFEGMGLFLVLAWPFPLIALLEGLIGLARFHVKPRGWMIGLLLACFAVLHLAWAGLHGSRLSMLGGMFLAAGFCHFLVRRFRIRTVVIGVVAALLFSFVYSFYKGAGREGLSSALSGTGGLAQAEQRTGRDFGWLLLGDLARADIQMEELWTMYDANPEYELKLGGTYVGAALFIPRSIWPTRPRGAQEAYAELQDGRIAVRDGDVPNSRVFGLTGETLLNFGWAGVPIAYAVFGILIGTVRRFIDSLRPGDARHLFVPLAVLLITALYLLDLSQVVFMLLQDCALLGTCTLVALWRPAPARATSGRAMAATARAA
ncbi:MAG TPA: hypothetical protein VGK30_21390 [Candidatus Binatia bacterium]|jgi:hypothetical protein